MKKIYLSAVAMVAMTTISVAQVQQEIMTKESGRTITKTSTGAGARTPTDTLGWGLTPTAQASLPIFAGSGNVFNYGLSTSNGYMYGVNTSANNFDGNVQGYSYLGAAKVEGVLMLAVGKEQGASHTPAAYFTVSAYNWSATGGTEYIPPSGPTQPCPGPTTAAASVQYLFDDFDTTWLAYNVATFASPPTFINDFGVGVTGYQVLKNTYSDTLGFLGDDQGDAGSLNYVFHKVGTLWYQTASIFTFGGNPADNNIAIFPIIQNVTSVEEAGFFQGMKMWPVYPNPTSTTSTLTYELENASDNVTLKVIDMKGAIVSKHDLGAQSAGKHNFSVDAVKLQSGAYYFMLKCDKGTLTQKFVVER